MGLSPVPDVSEDSGVRTKVHSPADGQKPSSEKSPPVIPPIGTLGSVFLLDELHIMEPKPTLQIVLVLLLSKLCFCVCVYCCTDYDMGSKENRTEGNADLSEDTDCDGSSLPEDSPEVETFA